MDFSLLSINIYDPHIPGGARHFKIILTDELMKRFIDAEGYLTDDELLLQSRSASFHDSLYSIEFVFPDTSNLNLRNVHTSSLTRSQLS